MIETEQFGYLSTKFSIRTNYSTFNSGNLVNKKLKFFSLICQHTTHGISQLVDKFIFLILKRKSKYFILN